jgi:hypothetical protein
MAPEQVSISKQTSVLGLKRSRPRDPPDLLKTPLARSDQQQANNRGPGPPTGTARADDRPIARCFLQNARLQRRPITSAPCRRRSNKHSIY